MPPDEQQHGDNTGKLWRIILSKNFSQYIRFNAPAHTLALGENFLYVSTWTVGNASEIETAKSSLFITGNLGEKKFIRWKICQPYTNLCSLSVVFWSVF